MVRKIAALAGAGALLLGAALPVFANGGFAIIKDNSATAIANTGGNTQDNYGDNTVLAGKGSGNSAWVDSSGSRSMTTGDAKAKAKLGIIANVNVSCDCDGCCDGGGFAVVKRNGAYAEANTGLNAQDNLEGNTVKAGKGSGNNASVDESGSRSMTTGDAKAKAKAWIVVNSSWSW